MTWVVCDGECSTEKPPWGNHLYTPRECPKGTLGCWTRHSVRHVGTTCIYCHTDGGHYTCPESDRGAFPCSNYIGRASE